MSIDTLRSRLDGACAAFAERAPADLARAVERAAEPLRDILQRYAGHSLHSDARRARAWAKLGEALQRLIRALLPADTPLTGEGLRRLLPWPAPWPASLPVWQPHQTLAAWVSRIESTSAWLVLAEVLTVFEVALSPRSVTAAWVDALPRHEAARWLKQLQDAPEDRIQQLVFADWLEEQGDPRAELVRLAGVSHEGAAEWLKRHSPDWLPAWLGAEVLPGRGLLRILLDGRHLDLHRKDDAVRVDALANLLGSGWIEKVTLQPAWEGPLAPWAVEALAWVRRIRLGQSGITDGAMVHLRPLHSLRELDLSECWSLSDHGLRGLAGLSSLQHLDLFRVVRLTDAGLASLAGLTQLRYLRLSACENLSDDGLRHLANLVQLRELYLAGCRIDGTGLQHLARLNGLERLKLAVCDPLSDRGLPHLSALTSLRHLDLSWCPRLSDAGLRHLAALTGLEHLQLSVCTGVGDAGVQHLAGLSSLCYLDLSRTQVTDAGLAHLAGLTALEHLNLSGCTSVNASGLARFEQLDSLRFLELSGCPVSDEALDRLPGLPALEHLSLRSCHAVSDAGLLTLGRHPSLRRVDLGRCVRITARGRQALQRRLPECQIIES